MRDYTLSSSRGVRTMESVCKPGLYVDGTQALAEMNDIVRADEIQKLEFYPTPQSIPAGYRPGGVRHDHRLDQPVQ